MSLAKTDFITDQTFIKWGARIESLKKCGVFKNISDEHIAELSKLSETLVFKKGVYIFREGDEARFFHVIHEGLVRIFKTSSEGKYVTFTIATRGDTLNASGLFLKRHFVSAQAMKDTVTISMEGNQYLNFVKRYPVVGLTVMEIMAKRLNWEYERLVNIIGEEVELRVVHSLCMLAEKFGVKLSITRQDLAEFSGTTTETTIRILAKLKQKGIISCSTVRGEIIISDLRRLQSYQK